MSDLRRALPEGEMVAVFHRADFLTFKISQRFHRFICAHDAEALIGHAEQMIAAVGVDITD